MDGMNERWSSPTFIFSSVGSADISGVAVHRQNNAGRQHIIRGMGPAMTRDLLLYHAL